ncbi:MAG: hypothetical protein V3W41_05125 [Planctomycetota bacterium]
MSKKTPDSESGPNSGRFRLNKRQPNKRAGDASPRKDTAATKHEHEPKHDAEFSPATSVEPGQMAQLIVDAREGAVDREAASAIARPLGELAKAFAVQAEILNQVHQTQARMQSSIEDESKRELMLNSTEALNDTFKGVRATQSELLDELRRERRGKRTLLIAGAVLGIALLGVTGFFMKEAFDARRDDGREGSEELSRRLAGIEGGVLPKYERLWKEAREERDDKNRELSELRGDLQARKTKILDMQGDLDRLESGQGADDAELRRLRGKKSEDETTISELRSKMATMDREVTDYLRRAETAEARANRLNDDILTRLKQEGSKFLSETSRPKPPKIVDGVQDAVAETLRQRREEEKRTAVATGQRDPGVVKAELNRLLGKTREQSIFRVVSIGEVLQDHLKDVVFTVSNPGRGVIKHVEAKHLHFSVSPRGDIVELLFEDGKVKRWMQALRGLGKMNPFYKGKLRITVLVLNGEAWLARRDSYIDVN